VSTDRSDRQREFDEANDFGFPLLSDRDKSVARQFGITRFGPLPIKRASFVIDTDRTVLAVVTSETDMSVHADQTLQALRERAT
jgi:thioredoxin-dependent peroxiredoxin